MATPSVKNFLELVQRSQLVDVDTLRAALMKCKSEHGDQLPSDAPVVAAFLVREGLLTQWHCDKLLDRKYKGFFLGKYKLLGHIGTGGMSSVYLAEHILMRRQRAIKVLPKSRVNDSSYLERFHREAQATAALEHPNVVRAYDVDNEGDTHYLVMEYVPGRDLQNIVNDEGALPYERAADYIAQAARGLSCAHQHGLIHRDVKPANLLVDKQGVVKLLDLGLALYAEDDESSLTIMHNENVLGTADYLAPEQAINSHDVDLRADIYGLGCTFYFTLTGHAPFSDGTLAQRIARHQSQMPPDIRLDRPDCPRELVEICVKMIQKKASERYASCLEIFEALESWLDGQASPTQTTSGATGRQRGEPQRAGAEASGKASAVSSTLPDVMPSREVNSPSSSDLTRDPTLTDTASDRARGTIVSRAHSRDIDEALEIQIVDPRRPASRGDDSGTINLGIEVEHSIASRIRGRSSRTSQRPETTKKMQGLPMWIWAAIGLGIVTLVVIVLVAILTSGGTPDEPQPIPQRPQRKSTA